MNILANGSKYVDPQPLLIGGRKAEGGEGEIYQLTADQVAKIYKLEERTDIRRKKVLALCNAYWRNLAEFGQDSYAFPQFPAYLGSLSAHSMAGFTMTYFRDCQPIDELQFNLLQGKFTEARSGIIVFNDRSAADFVYKIFELVEHLHKGRIVLGDINANNILYNSHKNCPTIIDLDSAQVGLHPCTATSFETLDPTVERQARTSGGKFYFSTKSDVYGLACVAFRFLVGTSPFSIVVSPVVEAKADTTPEIEAKRRGLSSIRYFVEGPSYLQALGLQFIENPKNARIQARLAALKQLDQKLFDFLYTTLAQNSRESLLYSLNVDDPRHPSNIFFVDPGVRKIVEAVLQRRKAAAGAASKKQLITQAALASESVDLSTERFRDPIEFGLFAKTFGLDLETLLS